MIRFESGDFFAYETVGEFRSDAEWIHPTRKIESYELIFVKEGTVYINEGGANYTLRVGDMILLEPNVIHGGWKKSATKTSFIGFISAQIWRFRLRLRFRLKVMIHGIF